MPGLKSSFELVQAGDVPRVAMTSRPYKVVDRRSTYGFTGGGNDQLYEASKYSSNRRQFYGLDDDTHRTISPMGRSQIMACGRWLFSNFPSIEGAIMEQAAIAVSSWFPRYQGKNKEWGALAEAWLVDWEDIMCVSGSWFDGDLFRELLLCSVLIDGELGILLTETKDGFPQVQMWMSHQIGQKLSGVLNEDFGQVSIVDGVVVNTYRRPRKYMLRAADKTALVPASDFILAYNPSRPDQVRGFSKLGSSVLDWQDLADSRRFELLAQKACSAHALIERNETGDTDDTKNVVQGGPTFKETGELDKPAVQNLEGGIYKYFTAKSGSSLEAFKFDRPGANTQQFQRDIEMHAFRGIDWDRGFTLDSSKINGTSIRVIVDRINRTILKRQKLVKKVMRRVHSYAIAKAIALGELPFDEDWFRWGYQVPAIITPDRKHQSDVDIQEYEKAFITLQEICAKRGGRWEETQDQWLLERQRMQMRAEELGVALPDPSTQQNQALSEEDVKRVIDENQPDSDSSE